MDNIRDRQTINRLAAFSLIELLVVMVIIALLVGLLLPALSRAKEEARKTQCRSNLRQIGMAIEMYAMDNSGYMPGLDGSMVMSAPYGIPTKASAIAWWDPYNGGVMRNHFGGFASWMGVSSNSLSTGNPQVWHSTDARPGKTVGLGRLWTGGYLTAKGAQIFYCPSNQCPKPIKELRYDQSFHYDADEPLWTSGGQVIRADGDGLGDPLDRWNAPSNLSPYFSGGNTYRSLTGCGYSRPWTPGFIVAQYCVVLSNYSVRVMEGHIRKSDTPADYLAEATIKIKQEPGRGIVADTVDPWVFRRGYGSETETIEEAYKRLKDQEITNHDASYNILFPNGTVKTFSDGGKGVYRGLIESARKSMADWNIWRIIPHWGHGSNPSTSMTDHYVWTPYFDGAYQQD